MGDDYPTSHLDPPCTPFEVKDRCRFFREGEQEKNYEILCKTYAVMGSCAGMKGWDMMWCRGICIH